MKIRFTSLLCGLLLLSVVEAAAYTDQDCIDCHARDAGESILKMPLDQFKGSVHGGKVFCQECHTQVLDEYHQETPGSGAVNCNACHDQENRHAAGSMENRPKCFNCHTRHHILPKDDPRASVHPDRLQQTCSACHPSESGTPGYLAWFTSIQIASHPKQDFSRIYSRKNCLGCHQGKAAHGEVEPISGQDCHTCHLSTAGQNKLWGVMHPNADPGRQPGVFSAAVTYQLVMVIMAFCGFRWLVRRFSKMKE